MYVVILSICIVVAAFVVQRFANQIDEQLNACGSGTFKDGVCECVHPYTGTHCEIVDCGYGKLVDQNGKVYEGMWQHSQYMGV